jgi:endogenous inhibitor of DNA gyrase (YacG/DUF329 family)
MSVTRMVACPQCGAPVEWRPESPWRPFCSERCKMIDLGAWAAGTYRVGVESPPDDDTPDPRESLPPRDD